MNQNVLPDHLLELRAKILKSPNLKGEINSILREYESPFLDKQKNEEQDRIKIKTALEHIILSSVPDSELRDILKKLSEVLDDPILGDWINIFTNINLNL